MVSRVPVSWFDQQHLRARLARANVSHGDPAWCIADGHAWGPYVPAQKPLPPVSWRFKAPTVTFEPIEAYRHCYRCGQVQDYDGNMRVGCPQPPAQRDLAD